MGGGAIRTVAKVAGTTAATSALRGITAEHYPLSASGRKTASVRPASASSEGVKLVASNSEAGVPMQRLEMDDWVFAGVEEEMVVSAATELMPRVVFGGVPTLQEAKQATSELTVALEKSYLSSPNSVVADHDASLSLSNKQVVETKACVSSDLATAPAVPAPSIMAFKFLQESTMVQNVVASIACDPNVWNAVLQNQELLEFLQSQRACLACSDQNSYTEFIADCDQSYEARSENSEPEPETVNGFMDILRTIKSSVVDMMSNLCDYLQNFFGGKGANSTVMEGSFMGLAVMVILVIVLKRA